MVTLEEESCAQLVNRTERSLDAILSAEFLSVKEEECPHPSFISNYTSSLNRLGQTNSTCFEAGLSGEWGAGAVCSLCYSAEFCNGLFRASAKPCKAAQQVASQWVVAGAGGRIGPGDETSSRVRGSVSGMVCSASGGT